jgi:YHS domain-containing protein
MEEDEMRQTLYRIKIWGGAVLFFGFCFVLLFGADKGPVNIDKNGVAVKGYDPVAYFTESRPVEGKKEFSLEWNGATWYFSSEENQELFKSAPEKYAPQYGGYCAYAMASGDLVDIIPQAWKIVNGKLYLNFSMRVHRKWEKDIPGYIEKADKRWPEVLKRLSKK